MRAIRRIVMAATFIFTFSISATAQDIAYYLFLETIDYQNKPVAGATVSFPSFNWRDKSEAERWAWERQTDESGKVRALAYNERYDFAKPNFRVTKPGYYPFIDLGTKLHPFENEFRLELLKIPRTEDEERANGNEQSKREFFWAARDGDAEKIRRLVKSGISPKLNTDDLRGVSGPKNIPAIMLAAASGDSETVEIFLKSKIKARRVETLEHSLLAYFLKAQPKLFWRRSPPAPSDEEKTRALREFEAGVKSLIAAGARLYKLDADGANALMIAAGYSAYTNIAKMLLVRGLPINARDDKGKTALHYANPYYDYEMIKLLLEAGADPNVVPEDDCSFLMQAIAANNFSNDGGGKTLDVIKLLVKYKADVNFTCKNGENALKLAGRPEVKKLLRDAGAK
jgi:ankyrin repeat protein